MEHQLHAELEERGMGHVAELLTLAAERPQFRNEALEQAPPVAPAEPIGGGDVVPITPPAGEPTPAPSEWAGPSREEWGQTQEVLGLLNEILRMPEPPAATPPEPAAPTLPELNVYDPASVIAHLEARDAAQAQTLERMFEERFGAYAPVLDQVAEQQGQQILESGFTQLEGEFQAKFDHERAGVLYGAFMTANPNLDPHVAMRAAAQYRIADEVAMREAGRQAYIEGLKTVELAPAAPPAAGAPGEVVHAPNPRDPDKYEKLANEWLHRRQAAPVSGVIG